MDDEFPSGTKDAAISGIFTILWGLYDDLREHKIDGQHRLSPAVRTLVERCVQFLKTDLEYEWPTEAFSFTHTLRGLVVGFQRLLRLNTERTDVGGQLKEAFSDAPDGDPEVWPFYRTTDYRDKIAKVRI